MIAIDNGSYSVFASKNEPRCRPRFRACQEITIRVQSRLPGNIDRGTTATGPCFQLPVELPHQLLDRMSDFEDDDMDIDGPPSKSIQFTSNNTNAKGKRIVADLPVEAEDNLPWSAHFIAWMV